MDIFKKYTRKSLSSNRSRTLVTIIGIVLSMALLTAVIEGAYSGIQWLIRGEIETNGKWEAYFNDLSDSEYETVKAESEIKQMAVWKQVGWAEIDSKNEYKPYLLINSISDDFTDMVAVHITGGRLPENDTEIMLPNHLASNGGLIYKIGDIINVSVGKRMAGDKELTSFNYLNSEREESIVDTTEKTYTVVGFYERFSREIEDYACPGFIALTAGSADGTTGAFVTVKTPSEIYEFYSNIGLYKNISGKVHNDLVNFRGTVRNRGLQTVVYGFATILAVMIAFGSVSLIYNSFSISLSERTKQFGILKSVGATKKQLRSSVLYEALLLAAIGIPAGLIVGCLGIGITLYCLRDAFSGFLNLSTVQMQLVINPVALIVSAIICLVVILISAWIPAGRAVRISPVEAVRQNKDTKIKAREVKTSKLTLKLFGFEGMMASKNFKRNGKRYRATIISLFMSVVLFISASSFCAYLTESVDSSVSDGSQMDIAYSSYGSENAEPDQVAEIASGIPGVEKISYGYYGGVPVSLDSSLFSDRYAKLTEENAYYVTDTEFKNVNLQAGIAFISDEEFRHILADNGLNESEYFDESAPKALFYNSNTSYIDSKQVKYDIVRSDAAPFTARVYSYKDIEGRTRYVEYKNDGANIVYYFDTDYLDEFWKDHDDISEADTSKAVVLTQEEAEITEDLKIGAVISKTSYILSTPDNAIIYPYSMYDKVFADEAFLNNYLYAREVAIGARDHAKVLADFKNALTEEGIDNQRVVDLAEDRNSQRMLVTIINVFSYGFIILISLIALANVFNTVSTSIMLRRREFAMLRSIGMSEKGFSKMMNYECIIYGIRSLLFGLPVALLATLWIYKVTSNAIDQSFYIPWNGVVIAVASVFVVVFATMLYATRRIRRDNPIDALRNENL